MMVFFLRFSAAAVWRFPDQVNSAMSLDVELYHKIVTAFNILYACVYGNLFLNTENHQLRSS